MDLLTHAVTGAVVGELMLGKRLGNRALAWGALAGILPVCLAMLVSPFLDTAARLWWHRGPSHSLLMAVLASLILAKPLAKFWKRDKIGPSRAGTFVFLAWGTHILLDCMNAAGASVFWPFSSQRVGFGHVPATDPLLTLPLLVCIGWLAFFRKPKQRPKRARLLGWGISLTGVYVAFSVAMRFTASAGFNADLARRGVDFERRVTTPVPYNALAWRAVVDRGDELWVGHRSVFHRRATPVRWIIYPRGAMEAGGYDGEREVRHVLRFADGYWIARTHNRGLWITDLRFGELRESGGRDQMIDHRMKLAWNFEPEAPKDRLIPSRPEPPGIGATLRETGLRILGSDEGSDLIPRLAGVPGRFPEVLMVVD